MNVEVLLSTMNNDDFKIVKKCNIHSDVLIINQCDLEKYEEKKYEFGCARIYSTKERGLSRSRNMALLNANADICILCDDDVVYVDNYVDIVKRAFEEVDDADVIVFNINRVNTKVRNQEKVFRKIKKIPKHKTYGSVHIAFKKESIISKNISFNVLFGTGSGKYSMAEDSLFFRKIHENRLKAYVYPAVIANVSFENSSWFKGYNEKYFYDIGAFLSEAYPKTKHILKWYYPIRLKKQTTLKINEILKYINQGFKGYKIKESYDEFLKRNFKSSIVGVGGENNNENK
ncbi:glycosyltransferase family 2 protein [Clostridium perfringens]|nr:glycosyltransferase family 2 protein [Clostridium perfringens]HAT4116551.1 glycosyltransferase family 2 protein [Clostridium perfringens]